MSSSDALITIEEIAATKPWLQSLAYGLVRDPGLADDLVQFTLIAGWRNPPARGAWRTWSNRVMRRALFAIIRRRRRQVESERDPEHQSVRSEFPDAAELWEREDLRKWLLDEIRALPRHEAEILTYRFIAALTPVEIHDRYGIPVETIKTRLKRAKSRLRERLERRGGPQVLFGALLPFAVEWEDINGLPGSLPRPPDAPFPADLSWVIPAAAAVLVGAFAVSWGGAGAEPDGPHDSGAESATVDVRIDRRTERVGTVRPVSASSGTASVRRERVRPSARRAEAVSQHLTFIGPDGEALTGARLRAFGEPARFQDADRAHVVEWDEGDGSFDIDLSAFRDASVPAQMVRLEATHPDYSPVIAQLPVFGVSRPEPFEVRFRHSIPVTVVVGLDGAAEGTRVSVGAVVRTPSGRIETRTLEGRVAGGSCKVSFGVEAGSRVEVGVHAPEFVSQAAVSTDVSTKTSLSLELMRGLSVEAHVRVDDPQPLDVLSAVARYVGPDRISFTIADTGYYATEGGRFEASTSRGTVGEDGKIAFHGLAPGRYRLELQSLDCARDLSEALALEFDAASGPPGDVVVTGASLELEVLAGGVEPEGAVVTISTQGTPSPLQVRAPFAGRRILMRPDSEYTLAATAPGYQMKKQLVRTGRIREVETVRFDLVPTAHDPAIQIELLRPDGRPLRSATAVLWSAGGSAPKSVVLASRETPHGITFAKRDLDESHQNGENVLMVRPGYEHRDLSSWWAEIRIPLTRPPAAGEVPRVRHSLRVGGRIAVRVVDGSGATVESRCEVLADGVRVPGMFATVDDTVEGSLGGSTTTSALGSAVFQPALPPGRCKVRVPRGEGLEPVVATVTVSERTTESVVIHLPD